MSSDGSFPHKRPSEPPEPAPLGEPAGGRVIEFPADEVTTPPPVASVPVPAGTWADEASERVSDVERLLRPAGVGDWTGGEVVELPHVANRKRQRQQDELSGQRPVADESGMIEKRVPVEPPPAEPPLAEHEPEPEEAPQRPKYLASELLRRDWTPKHPLRRTLRAAAITIGLVGAIGTPSLGGLAPDALGLALLFALCAAAGIAPLNANLRGAALATVGTLGAVCVGWLSHRGGTALLIACITLTASALFFRAAHNRVALARILVGVGLAAIAAWLMLTGGLDAMIVQSMDWQAWVEPASRMTLLVVGFLILLTFLDPSGPGGAWIGGFALLGWLALYAGAGFLLAAFPARGDALDPQTAGWMLRAALPLFAAVAAGGLCQVWVMVSLKAASMAKAAKASGS